MKRSKNTITLILMITSIVLLLVFQFFWLRGAYEDAEESFRTEINGLFRTTIFAMQDSLIVRSIRPIHEDSLLRNTQGKRFIYQEATPPVLKADSITSTIRIRQQKSSQLQVFLSTDRRTDSIHHILRPLITNLQIHKAPRDYIISLESDSLNQDSIALYFDKALNSVRLPTSYNIISVKSIHPEPPHKIEAQKETISSDFVPLNPLRYYAVSFASVQPFILQKISTQILFSAFLTLLTIGSFYLMYQNILSQQRLMQAKNDFISNITHELKTPVATVSVALEALKNFNALEDARKTDEYLTIAQNELDRLTLMTDKILKTAVFESKGVELKIDKIDLDVLVQQVLNSMKLVFEKRKTQITYERTGNDFTLEGAQAHLTTVLYNLLDNALKYSNDGASVHIQLKQAANQIVLIVKDTGIGIPAAYQKKIFEKFFRVPSGDVHNTKGYGLGLSYVASVVKSHHGVIEVQSQPGEGSSFIITLPKVHEN